MNGTGTASSSDSVAVVSRRARRRRASLSLYGRPLRPLQSNSLPDRRLDERESFPAPHVPTAATSTHDEVIEDAFDVDRETEALRQAIGRVQAEARRDPSLSLLLPASDLDRVVESTVRGMWFDSLIKTYVPVLALRHARESIRAAALERKSLEAGAEK